MREEVKKEERIVARDTVREMMNKANSVRGSRHEMMKLSEMMAMRANANIDLGYVKTLLFPELYNSDIPQPMSTQSYCRFTDKKELTLSSFLGSQQGAILVWYPKTIIGPQLFVRYGNLETAQPLYIPTSGTTAGDTRQDYSWRFACVQDYTPYFSQVNLVSASISIQYIGQLQLEQGYMVASQAYGVSPSLITADEVENGQFRTMCKPGDGLRVIYLPKDMQDFQYYPCNVASSGSTYVRNNGSRPLGEKINLNGGQQGDSSSTNAKYVGLGGALWPTQATAQTLDYAADGDAVIIYWKGLSATAGNDLRIDIVRKFNGFPQAKQRDILDLTKPKKLFDPKKTIDVIQELQSAIPQLCAHSLKQMDRVSDQIQEFLPNIGHLYDEGLLKEGTSLEGFADQLQQNVGTEGSAGGVIGRIYS